MKRLKRITVRIIPPSDQGMAKPEKVNFDAPRGQHWNQQSIETCLDRVIDYLDKKYPRWEFRMIALDIGRYNFVFAGKRGGDDAESVHGQEQDRDGTALP